MNILFFTAVDPWTRSVATLHKYAQLAGKLGHDVAFFGHGNPELPRLRFTTDISAVDLAVFVLQVPYDIPDMPGLAKVMDTLPRERRVVVDLWGRFNETVRVDHDFNHLEKFDGHPAWEWMEAIGALSDTVLQPTLAPRRNDVGSFLFHGFDPDAVVAPQASPRDAAARWREADIGDKPYGAVYAGSNWQRWTQISRFLKDYQGASGEVGQFCLAGWDWGQRPDWAVELGLKGVDTDPELLADLGVEIRQGIRFDQIVGLLGQGRFAPVFHRPLFRELGFVTNRTFETFYADSLPVLMLPEDFVAAIYGPAALKLVPGAGLAAHLADALEDPEPCWDAVFKTRAHLAEHHSFARRFEQLESFAGAREPAAATP